MDPYQRYTQASIKTAADLGTIAQSETIRTLSQLSLPQIEAVVMQVARLVPAGNIPGLILSGLARLPGRIPPPETVRQDINLLFKGVEQTLDIAVYSAVFAGPAAVIWGYQNLLKLSGKDPDKAFPNGLWQFYVEYALREDTARHTNETHGFDTALSQDQIQLQASERITAWAMAAIHCLHQYEALLTNEWRERVYTHLLTEITRARPNAARDDDLYRKWEKERPYGRGPDASSSESYANYRQRKFDQFLNEAIVTLPASWRQQWAERVRQAEEVDLPAYLRQMSILAYLDPGTYGETRTPIPLAQACLGLVHHGCYFLIPVCAPGTDEPAQVQTVQTQIATLLTEPANQSTLLSPLAEIKRRVWPALRRQLSQPMFQQLERLRLAPILLNFDTRFDQLPLSELRQAERGIGDHALTIFDTGKTFIFDQSHIFFDGAWGAALAEIMTQEALNWAKYIHPLEKIKLLDRSPPEPLQIKFQASDLQIIQQAPRVASEVGAETDAVELNNILSLRRQFKQRNEQIRLTVNDLLILYRAVHATTYSPAHDLIAELQNLAQENNSKPAALAAIDGSQQQDNPSIAIPVDASPRNPQARVYPLTFEVPPELEFNNLHQRVLTALNAYEHATGDRSTTAYAEFDRQRRVYLATLAGFGELLTKGKEIARRGESTSIGALKLLAYIPIPLQRLLDKVPERFDILNDLIKGREVLSNVGAVAPSSSLTRFISANDDSAKKTLVWGVITDAQGVMRITLRDFRPHVGLLIDAGYKELAQRLAQHYLDTYAYGLNNFIRDLQRITQTSRKTKS